MNIYSQMYGDASDDMSANDPSANDAFDPGALAAFDLTSFFSPFISNAALSDDCLKLADPLGSIDLDDMWAWG